MRWFISDIHFGHKNVIEYCKRPWSNVEEMNAGLVANINALVGAKDVVRCFGDFSLNLAGAEMVRQLNGEWELHPGNHDKVHSVMHKNKQEKKSNIFGKYKEFGFKIMPEYDNTVLVGPHGECIQAQICHFPYKLDHGNFEDQPRYQNIRPKPDGSQILLCGHVHDAWKVQMHWSDEHNRFIPQINLGVDVWDWKPVSEEELFLFAKKQIEDAAELTRIRLSEMLED